VVAVFGGRRLGPGGASGSRGKPWRSRCDGRVGARRCGSPAQL